MYNTNKLKWINKKMEPTNIQLQIYKIIEIISSISVLLLIDSIILTFFYKRDNNTKRYKNNLKKVALTALIIITCIITIYYSQPLYKVWQLTFSPISLYIEAISLYIPITLIYGIALTDNNKEKSSELIKRALSWAILTVFAIFFFFIAIYE